MTEPASPAVEPDRGAAELAAALESMRGGRLDEARREFEAVLALDGGTLRRPAALYGLGLLLARPDFAGRDVTRSRKLLEEYLATGPTEPEGTSARLVAGLLRAEAEQTAVIAELRGRVAAAGAESEDLRVTLAQREAELRRIKEILLGRAGGL